MRAKPQQDGRHADTATEALRCPVTGLPDAEFWIEQRGYRWVRFATSGFVRLETMPDGDDAAVIESDAFASAYANSYERKFASKLRRSRRRARYLRRLVRRGRILDVGSNLGFFVEACRELGFDAMGIEINPHLCSRAANTFPQATFVATPLEDFDDGEPFDGIYCSEVIEHVTDVTAFARRLHALLRPGGALYLTTPSVDEYLSRGQVVRDLGAPDHKLYFGPANLTRFLREAVGFARVKPKLGFGKGLQVVAFK